MTTTSSSRVKAGLRTGLLIATMSGILIAMGYLIGGVSTMSIFFIIALVFNFVTYFFSDKIALKASRAKATSRDQNPELYESIEMLATKAKLPMPRVYIIEDPQANAFATGRNHNHSAVAVTRGILQQLTKDELDGVLAHELAHIKHYDILTQSVASAIGTAITYVGYMFLWFGDSNSPLGLVASLLLWILAPLSATLIQMAVSRQREFAADAGGAAICGNPESLASALLRLEKSVNVNPMNVNSATESMYIVKPFKARGISKLFSTHPPTEERVKRLREMRPSL